MRNRIIWSEAEKQTVVARAADLRDERPDLAGLPLLREAMKVLPQHRRRKLIAVTQARWFEEGLTAELERRDLEARVSGDLLPILKGHADLHKVWRDKNTQQQETIITLTSMAVSLLTGIRDELRKLNEKMRPPFFGGHGNNHRG